MGGLNEDSDRVRWPVLLHLVTPSPSLLVHDLQSFGLDNVRTRWKSERAGGRVAAFPSLQGHPGLGSR